MNLKEGFCKETIVKYEGLARYQWQCKRKAVSDGLCTIHSPDYIAKRDAERQKKFDQESAARQSAWTLKTAARDLLEACQAALPWLEQRGNDEVVAKVKAAIKKATHAS